LEGLGVYGTIILKQALRKQKGGLSWINLSEDRNKWSGLVITVTKLRVPLTFWIFLDKVRNY